MQCLVVGIMVTPAAGQETESQRVTLKRIESAEIVYVEYQGPYWEIGNTFAEIGEFMAAHHQTGALFARFLSDPTQAAASELRAELGFFADESVPKHPRFQRKKVHAHLAAALVVDGPYAQSPAHYQKVFDWIEANGYTRGPGIIEVYPPTTQRQPGVEIRVPIVGKRETAQSEVVDETQVEALIAAKRYDRAAELLVPDEHALAASNRKWLADVIDRLRVVREIVTIKYGRNAGDVGALVTPLVKRGAWLSRFAISRGGNPRRSASPSIADQQKDAVVAALDRVMVRTHLNELTAAEIHGELAAILTLIQPIVEGRSTGVVRRSAKP